MSGKNSFRIRIIGLTGGVAAGKNFVAEIFAKSGIPVFDADKEVHDLMTCDQAIINAIRQEFPQSFVNDKIDRKILRKIVFAKKDKLILLENIIHPAVRNNYKKFIAKMQKQGAKIAILNIPLLHESGHYKCDSIIAVTASPSIKKRRFIARERAKAKLQSENFAIKEAETRFAAILSKQMTNVEHKLKAQFVINTNKSKSDVISQVRRITKIINQ